MSVQCQIVPSWSLYLSNLLLSLSWTVSALIEDLVCWACHFWVGLWFFIYISFFCLKASPYVVFNMKRGCGSHLFELPSQYFGSDLEHWQQIPQGYLGYLRWIDHLGLATDKHDMSLLGQNYSTSWLIHKGTVASGVCVSHTSQPVRHLGAGEEYWP